MRRAFDRPIIQIIMEFITSQQYSCKTPHNDPFEGEFQFRFIGDEREKNKQSTTKKKNKKKKQEKAKV